MRFFVIHFEESGKEKGNLSKKKQLKINHRSYLELLFIDRFSQIE